MPDNDPTVSDSSKAKKRIKHALKSRGTALRLSGLHLTDVPSTVRSLTQLKTLRLSLNRLKKLPDWLRELTELELLDVSSNLLASVPDWLGSLSKLRALNLNANKLSVLPASLGRLPVLQTLDVSGNRLAGLPTAIGSLGQLRHLGASGNRFTAVPEVIEKLVNLEQLRLAANKISAVPPFIGKLTSLRDLRLSGNHIKDLPESIGQLRELRDLRLQSNDLNALPEALRHLPQLTTLFLHRNPLLGLPEEILGSMKAGTTARTAELLDYYFRIQRGSQPLNEAKLILVGRGGVGKTCIVNRLVEDRFDAREAQTDGIRITQWKIGLSSQERVRLNIWDFGGQEVMHSTHQFFLTQRSLYLLVLNGREGGEDADVEYWLQLIESFGGESPVIIVLNKIKQHPFDLNRRALQQKYHGIRGFIRTDCEDRTGIQELDAAIRRETANLEDVHAPFPASWFAIKDHLASMEENYLSFDQFRKLCDTLGEREASAQEHLAANLHKLGIALNFKDDPRLRDTHVLNPRWITKGIYKILNSPILEMQNGVLHVNDVSNILDATEYPRSKHLFLLDLMKKFELCFEFPDDPQGRYLIPELLDKQEPDLRGEFKPDVCLNFEYRYSIIPEGLLPRFIVRTHVLSAGRPRWRSGVVLDFDGNRSVVKADAQDRKVMIAVNGPGAGRRRLLAVIRSDFERIHADITKVQVQEMVPIKGHPDVVVAYDELKVFEHSNLMSVPRVIGNRIMTIDVREMLNGVDLEGTRQSHPDQMERVRLFISYSHKDEDLRGELETHLKLLERQGIIGIWTDRKILAGEEWKGTIDENLESADIVLLLVSSDFLGSNYCYDVEMKRALQKHSLGQANVVPVLLRDVDWQTAPFARLQTLPKDAKPITLWQNRDSAWKDVAVGIRAIAQKNSG